LQDLKLALVEEEGQGEVAHREEGEVQVEEEGRFHSSLGFHHLPLEWKEVEEAEGELH
jgi:hypothetical protein